MALTKEAKSDALLDSVAINYTQSSSLVPASGIDTSSTVQIAVEVACTYGSASTINARLDVYGSMDDSNYSTQPFAVYTLTAPSTGLASATVRQIFGVANAPKYLKFKITNPDTATSNANLSAVSLYVQRQTV